jgi:hypothetical protein
VREKKELGFFLFLGFFFFLCCLPSNCNFFFVNFDFSCFFFIFLKTSNINVDSMRKINDFKVKENLNSF